jgi:predicted nucleic acid-binding protein
VLLGSLIRDLQLSGNLLPDAHLAALALEHGIGIYSTDTDFARFPELSWVNPLAA